MAKRKAHSFRKRLANFPVLFIALAFVILPLYATGNWLKVMVVGNDPRKVVQVQPLNIREIDKQTVPVQPFQEPLITITFDDGWESIYSAGLPHLQKYGVPTTQYILGDEFNNYVYLSKAQVKSMQKAGHEIASHTMTHDNLTLIDDEDLDWQLSESKRVLSGDFGPIYDFASPLGAYDTRTVEAIKKYYRSHRNTESDPAMTDDGDINTAANFNIYNIKAYTVRLSTTQQDLQNLIDYTVKNKGWLVLTYHQVDTEGATYSVTPQRFEEQLQVITKAPARITTMSKVLDAIQAQQRGAQ